MIMFWVAVLAVSILLYVLLDGFDLGVGILFGLTRSEERRHAMLSAVALSGTATRRGSSLPPLCSGEPSQSSMPRCSQRFICRCS